LNRGRLLRLALLPQLLEQAYPDWQRYTVSIDCDSRENVLAALILAQHSDALLCRGRLRRQTEKLLWQRWGCIPRQDGAVLPLEKLPLPMTLSCGDAQISFPLAEGLLLSKGFSPADIILPTLRQRAAEYHIQPSGSAR